MQNQPLPTDIELHKQSRYLEIYFSDGAVFRLPCEFLRVYSPSAEVRGHAPDEHRLQVGKEDVSITDLRQIGNYALKIFFDDGHKSGLYDWGYLYKLGSSWQALWRNYLDRLEEAGFARKATDPFAAIEGRGKRIAYMPNAQSQQ